MSRDTGTVRRKREDVKDRRLEDEPLARAPRVAGDLQGERCPQVLVRAVESAHRDQEELLVLGPGGAARQRQHEVDQDEPLH